MRAKTFLLMMLVYVLKSICTFNSWHYLQFTKPKTRRIKRTSQGR